MPTTVQLREARRSKTPDALFDLVYSLCSVPRAALVDQPRQFNAGLVTLHGSRGVLAYRVGSKLDWMHRVAVVRICEATEDAITLEDPAQTTLATLESKFGWPGFHTEDPRLCLVPSASGLQELFLLYTDGCTVGAAKLDPHDFSTIYSHYIRKPANVVMAEHTGLEKNWIPFSDGTPGTLYLLYSDTPRTIFKFIDNGSKLVYQSVWTHRSLRCSYGQPRGGAPPVLWMRGAGGRPNDYIWFFHTKVDGIYKIGAYVTTGGYFSITHITPVPLFTGSKGRTEVIFQCGALALPEDEPAWYVLSLGVQDESVAFLKVPRSGITLMPAEFYG